MTSLTRVQAEQVLTVSDATDATRAYGLADPFIFCLLPNLRLSKNVPTRREQTRKIDSCTKTPNLGVGVAQNVHV